MQQTMSRLDPHGTRLANLHLERVQRRRDQLEATIKGTRFGVDALSDLLDALGGGSAGDGGSAGGGGGGGGHSSNGGADGGGAGASASGAQGGPSALMPLARQRSTVSLCDTCIDRYLHTHDISRLLIDRAHLLSSLRLKRVRGGIDGESDKERQKRLLLERMAGVASDPKPTAASDSAPADSAARWAAAERLFCDVLDTESAGVISVKQLLDALSEPSEELRAALGHIGLTIDV
jgi:hypothetical protein